MTSLDSPHIAPDAPASTGQRRAGVLLPISSLSGPGPIGSLDGAKAALDWMAEAGFRYWQVLPIGPTDRYGSPYSSGSAWSGHPGLIGLNWLHAQGLSAAPSQVASAASDYGLALEAKIATVCAAAQRLRAEPEHPLYPRLRAWTEANPWAREAACFQALRAQQDGLGWWQWPKALRDRDPGTLGQVHRELAEPIETWLAALFLFDQQWQDTRDHAVHLGIQVIGDLPIYVAWDSVDVWCHRELFQLDGRGQPIDVAGCPPDAFSDTGQRWGNPLFDWPAHQHSGFRWFSARVRRQLELFDGLRIDHFIGFSRYYAVPFHDADARNGRWVDGPGLTLFEALSQDLGELPFWAEDLGELDAGTMALRDQLEFPGMVVLQFANPDDDEDSHHPQNYPLRCIAYPGTHDNDTLGGWWQRQNAPGGLGDGDERTLAGVVDGLLHSVLASRAQVAVLPFQDLLHLGSEARMNTPGTCEGNWRWRLPPEGLSAERARELYRLLAACNRLGLRTETPCSTAD